MKHYFAKNRLWMTPAIGGILAAAIPALLLATGGPKVDTLPVWLPLVPLSFGVVGTLVGAIHTDTASASLVRFIASAGVFAAFLYSMTK